MSIPKTSAALAGLFLFMAGFAGLFLGCHLDGKGGDATLSVDADASLLGHERVLVILKDLPGGPDTLFDGKLTSLDTLSRLPAGSYNGKRVLVVIQGISGGLIVYEEHRDYDGGSEKVVSKEIPIDEGKPGSGKLDLKPDRVRLFHGGGTATLLVGPKADWEGRSLEWSTGDPSVATVTSGGVITPVGVGVTWVRAYSSDTDKDASPVQVVRDPPVIDAGAADTAIKTGDEAAFGAKVTQEYGVVASFAWDLDGDGVFEDSVVGREGQTAFATKAKTFDKEGTLTIKLQARDGEGNVASVTKSIKVTSIVPAVESLSADDSLISIKDSVAFAAKVSVASGSLRSFGWDFDGDGKEESAGDLSGTSADLKGAFAYPVDGVFQARLRVTDGAGTAVSRAVVITVKLDRPVVDAGRDLSVAAGVTVRLKGTAKDSMGSIQSREWKIGDGAFAAVGENGETTFPAPATPGEVLCIFRATDDDSVTGVDTLKVTVGEALAPVLGETSPKDTTISIRDSISIKVRADAAGADLKSYALDADGDGTADATGTLSGREADIQAGRRYPNAGVFNAALKVEDQSGKSTSSTVKVTVKTDAPFADAGADTTVAAGGRVNLNGTSRDTLGSLVKHEWKIGAAEYAVTSGPDTAFTAPTSSATVTCYYKVTDDDGLTAVDSVKVTVGASATANLSALTLSAGNLAPAFAAGTLSYTASVPNGTATLTVTATAANPTSTLKVNGTTVASGAASDAIALAVGNNAISVEVTAQNGSTKRTYTVTVNRAGNGNADLSGLSLSAGTLAPAFAAATTGYTATVANAVPSITVSPTAAVAGSTILVDSQAVVSGTASGAIALEVGPNVITVEVTAQDGVTKKTYTVTVSRTGSANDDLSALALSAGTLAPPFATGTIAYTASVPNATASITATPTAAGPGTSITVNGATVASGAASGNLALAVGANPVTVVVTAQDGTTRKTYTATVTRAASNNANLSALVVSAGTLSPDFATGTLVYNVSVANATGSMTVTPTAAGVGAVIRVKGTVVASGTASGAIALPVGIDTIPVLVTAQNGSTVLTYKIAVTRAVSTDPSLTNLVPSAGTLSPDFAAATLSYTLSVPTGTATLTLNATAANSGSTININNVTTPSGTPSAPIDLRLGWTEIPVYVLAGDLTTSRSYTVTVFREAPSTMTAAYAWVDSPTSSHTLTSHTYNPGGGAVTFTRNSVGSYSITWAGLGTLGGSTGHVQVSPYNNAGVHCKVVNWSGGTDLTASINCYTSAGALFETSLTALVHYQRASGTGHNAFLWANQSSAAAYTPSLFFNWNSSGQQNTVTRSSAGRYVVLTPGLASATEYGTPMVTAYGSGNARCLVEGWSVSGANISTSVACYASTGTFVDAMFNFAMILPTIGTGYGTASAYVSGAGTASGLYSHNSGDGAITVTNATPGSYAVTFAGLGSTGSGRLGTAQVVGYSSGGNHCTIGSWGGNPNMIVTVNCHNNLGGLANTSFNIWFTK